MQLCGVYSVSEAVFKNNIFFTSALFFSFSLLSFIQFPKCPQMTLLSLLVEMYTALCHYECQVKKSRIKSILYHVLMLIVRIVFSWGNIA